MTVKDNISTENIVWNECNHGANEEEKKREDIPMQFVAENNISNMVTAHRSSSKALCHCTTPVLPTRCSCCGGIIDYKQLYEQLIASRLQQQSNPQIPMPQSQFAAPIHFHNHPQLMHHHNDSGHHSQHISMPIPVLPRNIPQQQQASDDHPNHDRYNTQQPQIFVPSQVDALQQLPIPYNGNYIQPNQQPPQILHFSMDAGRYDSVLSQMQYHREITHYPVW